jgi:hypothetical protein
MNEKFVAQTTCTQDELPVVARTRLILKPKEKTLMGKETLLEEIISQRDCIVVIVRMVRSNYAVER